MNNKSSKIQSLKTKVQNLEAKVGDLTNQNHNLVDQTKANLETTIIAPDSHLNQPVSKHSKKDTLTQHPAGSKNFSSSTHKSSITNYQEHFNRKGS